MAFNKDNAEIMMGWNDEIEDDGKTFDRDLIVLPEGDYEFTIVGFKKGQQKPTEKIPSGCNRAELILKISTEEGTSLVNENLLLIKSMEWKLSAFFRALGLKKHGEKLVMNWNEVYNETTKKGGIGKAHFKVETFQRKDGTEGSKNVVDKYFDKVVEPWN